MASSPGRSSTAATPSPTRSRIIARRSPAAGRRPGSIRRIRRPRLAAVTPEMLAREQPYPAPRVAQRAKTPLPLLPTTTIGSFPQTDDVRKARAVVQGRKLRAGRIRRLPEGETAEAVRWQEEVGLDVLVHGEFERNDMVEYFGENLDGFAFTENGWVQSYGSRCVKPPIIFGDVARRGPMTVEWARYAQSLTDRPMKGMLTGPVTILQWSFVRDDQPRSETCWQIALAIRDEVADLEAAGIAVIQIDEPALREGLPLRRADWDAYLRWAVDAFRLHRRGAGRDADPHAHVLLRVQRHHRLDRGDGRRRDLDRDLAVADGVARGFRAFRYPNEIGPGVYDIHSPRVPTREGSSNCSRRRWPCCRPSSYGSTPTAGSRPALGRGQARFNHFGRGQRATCAAASRNAGAEWGSGMISFDQAGLPPGCVTGVGSLPVH